MPLIKNKISIPFASGINTKTDDKQDSTGSLESLKNAIFDTVKSLRKRNGYLKLSDNLISGVSISNPRRLAKFKNELGLITDTNYYSYSKSLEKWTDKGSVFTAFPESNPITRDEKSKSSLDAAYAENLAVYTYEDSEGVKVSILDTQTNSLILRQELISASGELPRVAIIQNLIFIVYQDSSDIKYRTINLIKPTTVNSEQTFVSDMNTTDKNFDIVAAADKVNLVYNNSSSELSIRNVEADGTLSSTTVFASEDPSECLTVETDSQQRLLVVYGTTTDAKIIIQSPTITANILAATSIETISNVSNITVTQVESSYEVYYEISAASVKNHMVKKSNVTLAGAVSGTSILMRSVGIAAKSFNNSDVSYVPVVHESTLQSTYFVINSSGDLISKYTALVAGGVITNNILPKSISLENDQYLIPNQIKGRVVTDDGTFFSPLGVNSTILSFEIADEYQNEQLGDNLHITGGVIKQYDGDVIVEHGFQVFPEDLSAGSTATTGGSISDGTRQYVAVYAWTDNYGQLHRSAPSIGLEVVLSGGTSTQTQEIVIPTLRITQKDNAIIELYRTEDTGDIFYKVTSTTSPTANDKTTDTITFEDTISDTDLLSNEILYTTGGVLDNIAAPSAKFIESFNDRIFLAGLDDKNKLVFSKIRDEFEPVEFNDTLYKYISEIGGDITALKTMDDKIIIFKNDALFYMSGDGPNDLGEQDTFVEPQRISSEVGCIDSESVVLSPLGLFFKSRKGIYLLQRNLSLQYIGAPVEEFNSDKITSAVVVPDANQIRFTTNNQNCLVYNYYVDQWAIFDNHEALSAINVNDEYYYLREDSSIYKEDSTMFTDAGSYVNMKLETTWISIADIQGFQRVYKLLLLGEFKSPHKLRIRVAYDFVDAFVQEVIIDTADFTDSNAYGDYSPYGDPSTVPYGGSGNLHQVRVDLARQKCQSIKFIVEEIQDSIAGEGLSLSNIMLEVGVKQGVNKPSQTNTYGTAATD